MSVAALASQMRPGRTLARAAAADADSGPRFRSVVPTLARDGDPAQQSSNAGPNSTQDKGELKNVAWSHVTTDSGRVQLKDAPAAAGGAERVSVGSTLTVRATFDKVSNANQAKIRATAVGNETIKVDYSGSQTSYEFKVLLPFPGMNRVSCTLKLEDSVAEENVELCVMADPEAARSRVEAAETTINEKAKNLEKRAAEATLALKTAHKRWTAAMADAAASDAADQAFLEQVIGLVIGAATGAVGKHVTGELKTLIPKAAAEKAGGHVAGSLTTLSGKVVAELGKTSEGKYEQKAYPDPLDYFLEKSAKHAALIASRLNDVKRMRDGIEVAVAEGEKGFEGNPHAAVASDPALKDAFDEYPTDAEAFYRAMWQQWTADTMRWEVSRYDKRTRDPSFDRRKARINVSPSDGRWHALIAACREMGVDAEEWVRQHGKQGLQAPEPPKDTAFTRAAKAAQEAVAQAQSELASQPVGPVADPPDEQPAHETVE